MLLHYPPSALVRKPHDGTEYVPLPRGEEGLGRRGELSARSALATPGGIRALFVGPSIAGRSHPLLWLPRINSGAQSRSRNAGRIPVGGSVWMSLGGFRQLSALTLPMPFRNYLLLPARQGGGEAGYDIVDLRLGDDQGRRESDCRRLEQGAHDHAFLEA